MIELSVIKLALSHANAVDIAQQGLSSKDLPQELAPVYTVLQHYHAENEADLSVDDLANLFFASVNRDKAYYTTLFENLKTLEVGEYSTNQLIASIVRNRLAKETSVALYEMTEGKRKFEDVAPLLEALKAPAVELADELEFVSDDIEVIVKKARQDPGKRWRLKTMNKMLGSLRKGDFGLVFARVETGKTTFLCSEISRMAEDGEEVHWYANEEEGGKVMMRFYQSAFNIDLPTLESDLPGWRKKFREKYPGNIKLISDMSFMNRRGVERLSEKYQPKLIIIDQLSKIKGFDNDRKDLELGDTARWARELAKQYGPVIGVHQADGTAENLAKLNMGHMANAKTALQAEADWILGIGCVHKPEFETIRFLNLVKNKLAGDTDTDPALRHGFHEVLIDITHGRYKDMY